MKRDEMEQSESRSRFTVAVAVVIVMAAFVVVAPRSQGQGPPSPGSADLSITKTDAKDPVSPGAPIDYTITVTNTGPDTALDTVVTDSLPKGSTFVSATPTKGTCTAKGSKVTCELGDLTKNGSNDTSTINLRVTAPTKSGIVTNKATVKSDTDDPNKANDTATQTTRVAGGGGGVPSCFGSQPTIVGTSASEAIVGTNGRDVIFGAGGADVIKGLGGRDLICGAGGDDRIKGGDGADRVAGGGGRDRLGGQAGNDLIRGGGGRDRLRGGPGNDRLVGGKGNDRCAGGPGRDVKRSC